MMMEALLFANPAIGHVSLARGLSAQTASHVLRTPIARSTPAKPAFAIPDFMTTECLRVACRVTPIATSVSEPQATNVPLVRLRVCGLWSATPVHAQLGHWKKAPQFAVNVTTAVCPVRWIKV